MPGANLSSPTRRTARLQVILVACLCLFVGGRQALGGPTQPPAAGTSEPPPSETIAITKLPFSGIASEVQVDLQGLLQGVLHRAGFNILETSVVDNRLSNEQRLLGCSTPSCYGRLAQVLGVRRVVEGDVQRLELSTFAMKLWLRDLRTGKLVAPPVKEHCDVCSSEDVRQMVLRAAETLAQMAPPMAPQEAVQTAASGMLVLETDPPGAQIFIDKVQYQERTPASLLLGSGVHEVAVRGQGYRRMHRQIEILPGQQVPLNLVLTPLPQSRPWLTALSWTSLTLAVGLVVTSALLLHYDGLPVTTADCPDQPGVMFRCPLKTNLLPGGVAAGVGAGVLAIGSGLAFYFDLSAPRRRPIVATHDASALDPAVPPSPSQSPSQSPPAPATPVP